MPLLAIIVGRAAGRGTLCRMLRLWVWLSAAWEGDGGRFDELACRAPVQAALLVGIAFGVVVWLGVGLLTFSVAPFDAFVAPVIVFAPTFGALAVWLRGRSRWRK
jgi:hypothetical protein